MGRGIAPNEHVALTCLYLLTRFFDPAGADGHDG